jgi:hypothetical protein
MDPYPQFILHPDNSNFNSEIRLDLWCKRNITEEEPYVYCAAFNISVDFTS